VSLASTSASNPSRPARNTGRGASRSARLAPAGCRAFLQRAVRFLAGEAGIRQIIDVGTGLPAAGNVHEVAPDCAGHAGGLRRQRPDRARPRRCTADRQRRHEHGASRPARPRGHPGPPEGPCPHRLRSARRPAAGGDLALHHRPGGPGPHPGRLPGRAPAGSYLALSHATGDFRPAAAQQAAAVYDQATSR